MDAKRRVLPTGHWLESEIDSDWEARRPDPVLAALVAIHPTPEALNAVVEIAARVFAQRFRASICHAWGRWVLRSATGEWQRDDTFAVERLMHAAVDAVRWRPIPAERHAAQRAHAALGNDRPIRRALRRAAALLVIPS